MLNPIHLSFMPYSTWDISRNRLKKDKKRTNEQTNKLKRRHAQLGGVTGVEQTTPTVGEKKKTEKKNAFVHHYQATGKHMPYADTPIRTHLPCSVHAILPPTNQPTALSEK